MKTKRYYLLFFFLLIIFLILTGALFFLILNRPVQQEVFNSKFIVGENLGFDLNSSALVFGKITQGSSITRNVDIKNDYNFPVEIKVFTSKDMADLITVPKNLSVSSKQNISVPVTLRIPKDFAFGEYSGKIKFSLYRINSIF